MQRALAVPLLTSAVTPPAPAPGRGCIGPGGALAPAPARGAALSCARKLGSNAFAGHRVQVNGKACYRHTSPYRGRTWKFRLLHTSEVAVTLPSTVPVGAGEAVELVDRPKIVREDSKQHTYRFTV